jgi:hypothetical protein
MHCYTSSAPKEEPLIPWTSDPFGRPQSHEKSEFRRPIDLPSSRQHKSDRRLLPVKLGRVASLQALPLSFRFGSFASFSPCLRHFRFTPQSGAKADILNRPFRARIGRSHRGTGDTIASKIGCMRSMTGPVDMTSDRDTGGSLKPSRRLKEVGAYAIASQRIQTGRPGDFRTG